MRAETSQDVSAGRTDSSDAMPSVSFPYIPTDRQLFGHDLFFRTYSQGIRGRTFRASPDVHSEHLWTYSHGKV